ncbi:hypothetical protein INR49_015048, partial [Caranx melampygus]
MAAQSLASLYWRDKFICKGENENESTNVRADVLMADMQCPFQHIPLVYCTSPHSDWLRSESFGTTSDM